jgi:hypothetical protein
MKKDVLKNVPGPLAIALSGVLLAGNVVAAPATFGDGGTALQGVLDGITVGGSSSVNVTTDALGDVQDTTWQIGGAGGALATLIIELAGFANSNIFGIYDLANPSSMVQIFNGAATSGSQAVVSILLDGSVTVNFGDTGVDFAGNAFGFYLDSTANAANGGGLFHSDTSLNSDGLDHMYAYQGTGDTIQVGGFAPGPWLSNEYILAWEDLVANVADRDYEDMVLIVESVRPVPLPPAVLLFGSALIGVTAIARRRKQSATA